MNLRSFLKNPNTGLLILLLASGGCARKLRDPFSFPVQPSTPKPAKLSLPCVQEAQAIQTKRGIQISWPLVTQQVAGQECTGYAIYYVTKDLRIAHNPLIRLPASTTQYLDTANPDGYYGYLVRAQFGKAPHTAEGPASPVAWLR